MCLIWGSTFLFIRIGNEAVAPEWAAAIRLAIATGLYALILAGTRTPLPRGARLRAAALYGLFNYGIQFPLLYWGELRVPSGTTAVFYGTVPLTTSLFAAWMGVHPLRRHEVVGALVGFLGIVVIFLSELLAGAPSAALVAIFLATVSAALSGIFLKRAPPQSTWGANGVGAAVGLAVCFLASVALGEAHAWPHGAAGWGPILYLVLAGNMGAYALYGWLVTQWRVTTVSAVSLVIPVVAVILGALIRSEAPPAATYAGAALVLAGVAITLFSKRRSDGGAHLSQEVP